MFTIVAIIAVVATIPTLIFLDIVAGNYGYRPVKHVVKSSRAEY